MTTRTDDRTEDCGHGVDGEERTRYADLKLENGDVVIYDRTDQNAWIQSASAVRLGFMR